MRTAACSVSPWCRLPARTCGPSPVSSGAFEEVAPYDPGRERRVLKLEGASFGKPLHLAPVGATTIRSLSPAPYTELAQVWASVTPIVLDRHLKRNGDREIREIIAGACENAGLPASRSGSHSSRKALRHRRCAASAAAWLGAPPWTRWKTPESLATRSLVHAVVDFGRAATGPVMLGAGRFTGLGLCRRLGS